MTDPRCETCELNKAVTSAGLCDVCQFAAGYEAARSEYRTAIQKSAQYPGAGTGSFAALNYTLLGLAGEAGELLDKWKKHIRGDDNPHAPADGDECLHAVPGELTEERRLGMLSEAGDLRWYLERFLVEIGSSMAQIEALNVAKCRSRVARGVLKGDGDDR